MYRDPREAGSAEPVEDELDGALAAVDSSAAGAGIPIVDAPVPPPSGWSDPLTGADGPHYWDRILVNEGARVRRYKRASTVVLVEVTGLARLARQWGPDVAERALVMAGRQLAREIRPSDHIARIDQVRFGILLPETSEIEAINFVERARGSCEAELEFAAGVVGVGFGWASPPKGAGLIEASALAAERLNAELKGN